MTLKLEHLNNCFVKARKENAKYIAIKVQGVGKLEEVIINPAENFDAKQSYYNYAYNEDLTLKTKPEIRVIGFTQADSYQEAQALLEV